MAVANLTNGPVGSDELLPVLHKEITRLPERNRLAVIYCDLESILLSATLHVVAARGTDRDDLSPWLEAARGRKGLSDELEWRYLPRSMIAPAPRSITDAEGRL
jgi:hypothetical protein